MARKRSQTAPDHPSHWIIGLVIALAMPSVLPGTKDVAALLFLVCLIGLPFSVAAHNKRKARVLALQDLQSLDDRELELHVARVLAALPGWKAYATRGSSDQGADVIATNPNGQKVAVQVKHYRNNVGNKAVQEIVASKALYGCEYAVVFTSGPGYTRAARKLAQANRVPLWVPADLFRIQDVAAQGGTLPKELLPMKAAQGWLGG